MCNRLTLERADANEWANDKRMTMVNESTIDFMWSTRPNERSEMDHKLKNATKEKKVTVERRKSVTIECGLWTWKCGFWFGRPQRVCVSVCLSFCSCIVCDGLFWPSSTVVPDHFTLSSFRLPWPEKRVGFSEPRVMFVESVRHCPTMSLCVCVCVFDRLCWL